MKLKFDGSRGWKPQAEARRYVYSVLVAMLDHEVSSYPENVEGWMFGGIDNEFDRRRLEKAIRAVQAEMLRKANR